MSLPSMLLPLVMLSCGLLDGGAIDETCEDLPGGCGGGGDGGGDDTGSPITIAVDSLEPVYGLTTGGEPIVIRGGPFAADVQVRFGDEPAEVRTWLTDELRVLSPQASAAGWVDVTVTTSAGEGAKSQGYRYFRDGTGQTGMLGRVKRVRQTGALSSLGETGDAQVAFITPQADATIFDAVADSWDSCRRDWSPDLGWDLVDPGASSLTLTSQGGADPLVLAWDSAEVLFNGTDGDGEVDADLLVEGDSWGIDDFSGTDLPAFAIAEVVTLPPPLTLSSPDLESTALVLGIGELDFTWDEDATSTGLVLLLTLVDGGTGSQVEKVSCLVEDDGAFSVPPTTFQSWAAGLTLYVEIGRALETTSTLPLNNADTRLVGIHAILGAAVTE